MTTSPPGGTSHSSKGVDSVAPPGGTGVVPAEDRDALIKAAKQRLSALVNAQHTDVATAAIELAKAEAGLRLAGIHDARAVERLWRSLAYFAVVAGVILLTLASCKVSKIEVEGTVRSGTLYFRASDFTVMDLEASTPTFIAAFGGHGEPATESANQPIDVEAGDSGRIAINQISFPRGSELEFTASPDGVVNLQVRCGTGCDTARVNLTFSGTVRFRNDTFFARTGPLELPLSRGENYLEFRLRDSTTVSGTSVIRADTVAFSRDQLRVAGERERPVSTPAIMSGELRNMTMNGKREALGRNARLAMGTGRFAIRSVRLEGGAFVTEFTGAPRVVEREGRSLVPSRLEWLWTREPLVIFWTIFGSLVATMAAAIQWKTSST